MFPSARVKLLVRRGSGLRSQSQNRVEGIHWVEPAVKAEDVLVEIRLQVLRLDTPMVCPEKPRL